MINTNPYLEVMKNQKVKHINNLRNELQQVMKIVLNDQDSTVEGTSMEIPLFSKNVGNTAKIMENITNIVDLIANYENNPVNVVQELVQEQKNIKSKINTLKTDYKRYKSNQESYQYLVKIYNNLLFEMQIHVETDGNIFNKEKIFGQFKKLPIIQELQEKIKQLFKDCLNDLNNNLDITQKLKDLYQEMSRFRNFYKFFLLSDLDNIRKNNTEQFVQSVKDDINRDELSPDLKTIYQSIVGNQNTLIRFEEKVMLYNDGTPLGKARTELYRILKPLETTEERNDARFEFLKTHPFISHTPVKKFYELCQQQYYSDWKLLYKVFNDFMRVEEKAKNMKLTQNSMKKVNKQLQQSIQKL